MKSVFAAAFLAVFLMGCTSLIKDAGIARITFDRCGVERPTKETPFCVEYVSGREIGKASASITLPDGTKAKFNITGVKAFEGQKVAAQAVKGITKDVTAGAVKIIPGLLKP